MYWTFYWKMLPGSKIRFAHKSNLLEQCNHFCTQCYAFRLLTHKKYSLTVASLTHREGIHSFTNFFVLWLYLLGRIHYDLHDSSRYLNMLVLISAKRITILWLLMKKQTKCVMFAKIITDICFVLCCLFYAYVHI